MTPVASEAAPETIYRENLSAGVDGELTREELRFLLRRLDHDVDLQRKWARYHIARDVFRKQPLMAGPGIAERVQRAIEQPDVGVIAMPVADRRMHHWLRWSGGGAIAAGVAVAALMLAQPTGDGSRRLNPATSSQSSVADLNAAPQPTAPAAVPPWLSNSSASQYSQQAAATLGESFGDATLPYARSVSPYQLQKLHALREQPGYLFTAESQPSSPRESRRAASAQ